MGALLRELKLVPDLIVSSDAVRAEATARAAADAAGYTGRIVLSPELYHSSPATIVNVLQSLDDTAHSVMIVAHNPGLEDLVKRLTGQSIELPTATLVHVELPASRWSEVTLSPDATLVDVWRPREL